MVSDKLLLNAGVSLPPARTYTTEMYENFNLSEKSLMSFKNPFDCT